MEEAIITRTQETKCKTCQHKIDSLQQDKGTAVPKKDDLAICFYCGQISVIDDDLNLRAITDQEWEDLHPDNKKQLQEIARHIKREIQKQ